MNEERASDRGNGERRVRRPAAPADEGLKAAIGAVERAVSEILADAREEVHRRAEQADKREERISRERAAMMSALRDALLEQATTVKNQSEMLIATLDLAIDGLRREREMETPAPDARSLPEESPPPPGRKAPAPGAADRQRALEELRERVARATEASPDTGRDRP